jgi:RNA polymerase sigma-70 factor (ECF subfamily)
VLEVIYLVFTEGYQATQGDAAVRRELCREAIRLGRLVVSAPGTATPSARALLALMLLQGSRLPERPDDEIRLLDAQRREHWDRVAIADGLRLLGTASEGSELSEYHLEAGIAAEHASAPRWEDTNWERILRYYELLRARSASPVLAVGHAVAVHMAQGAAAAGPLFTALVEDPRLDRYFPCHVAAARNAEERGAGALARARYRRALELPCSEPEARFVRARLDALS